MPDDLTNMSYKVLKNLYEIYLKRVSKTNDIVSSKNFLLNPIENDLSEYSFFESFKYPELKEYIEELYQQGYVENMSINGNFYLSNKAIRLMENRGKNLIKETITLVK